MTRRSTTERRLVSRRSSLQGDDSRRERQNNLLPDSSSQSQYDIFLATVCPPNILVPMMPSGHPIPRCEVLSSPRLPVRAVGSVSMMRPYEENEELGLRIQ